MTDNRLSTFCAWQGLVMSSLGIAKSVFGLCVVATFLLGSCTAKPYSEYLHGLYGSRPMVVCADGHSTYQHIKQVATILPLTKYIATLVHPLQQGQPQTSLATAEHYPDCSGVAGIGQNEHQNKDRLVVCVFAILMALLLLALGVEVMMVKREKRRNRELLKKMNLMNEHFYSNVTHQVRSAITLILGLSKELGTSEDLPLEAQRKAQNIEKQGEGLYTLISQLLDVARAKSADINPGWTNSDLMAHLDMVVESYRQYAEGRNVNLQFVGEGKIQTDFVPEYINKVMNNLLFYAFKFTPHYGSITVKMVRKGSSAVITISDTGPGVAPEIVPHIFEPFSRMGGVGPQVGPGIGLAFVKYIVEALGGDITLESELQKGCIVTIKLPIKNECKSTTLGAEMVNTPLLPAETEPLDDDNTPCNDEQRVLVVEDNADLAAFIGSLFANHYAVYYACNGTEAMTKAMELVPDIIITDRLMPDIDGLEVCRQVRQSNVLNHIPIVVVTGKVNEKERLEGIKAGADAYLTKPFNSEELITRVEMLLERHQHLRKKYAEDNNVAAEEDNHRNEAEQQFVDKVTSSAHFLLSKRTLDVNALADSLNMSVRQFHRKLVAVTGNTPGAFILNLKMEKAKWLLDNEFELTIEDISDRCGFEHSSSFYHAFKKAFGLTPAEYRKGGM